MAHEPVYALVRLADSWMGGQYLDHQIGWAIDSIPHDERALVRDEEQIGLYDESACAIEYDVEWRDPHLSKLALRDMRVEGQKEAHDRGLMAWCRRVRKA